MSVLARQTGLATDMHCPMDLELQDRRGSLSAEVNLVRTDQAPPKINLHVDWTPVNDTNAHLDS